MRYQTNIITIFILVVAIAFIVFALGFSRYTVYDQTEKQELGKSSSIMGQARLVEEMSYDAIALDKEGKLTYIGRTFCKT